MVISIRNTECVRCREDVRFSEGPIGGSTVYLHYLCSVHNPYLLAEKIIDLTVGCPFATVLMGTNTDCFKNML